MVLLPIQKWHILASAQLLNSGWQKQSVSVHQRSRKKGAVPAVLHSERTKCSAECDPQVSHHLTPGRAISHHLASGRTLGHHDAPVLTRAYFYISCGRRGRRKRAHGARWRTQRTDNSNLLTEGPVGAAAIVPKLICCWSIVILAYISYINFQFPTMLGAFCRCSFCWRPSRPIKLGLHLAWHMW